MLDEISIVKKKLTEAISRLCEVSWMFAKNPERDFSRKRKLPFDKVISFLLAMEGGSLATEMLNYFGCSANAASSSAFVQQRRKIDPSAFSSLFDLFVQITDAHFAKSTSKTVDCLGGAPFSLFLCSRLCH